MEVSNKYPTHEYVPIMKAGAGEWGTVYFSLSKQDFDAAVQSKKLNIFEDLSSKLVAVKVFSSGKSYKEAMALQKLQAEVETHHSSQDAFPLIYQSGEDWLAMRAIVPSLTLHDLYPFPRELLLHFLLELMEAGRFMHEVCTPPIAHGDLHLGNTLVDITKESAFGLPPLVLIDFGFFKEIDTSAKEVSLEEDVLRVLKGVRKVLFEMKQFPNDGERIEGWDDIYHYLVHDAKVASFKELDDALRPMATKALAAVPSERIRELKEFLRELAEEKESNLDGLKAAFRQQNLLS